MTVVILASKALVVFSRTIVNLHLPDPAPGDAVLSAVAAEQRAETRWSTCAVYAGPDRGSPSPRKDNPLSSILAHKRLDSTDPPFLG